MPANTQHPVFKQPETTDASIWRYMDFSKFVAMLGSASLYFARADRLGNPFEGSSSRVNEKTRVEFLKAAGLSADSITQLGREAKARRHWMFINCWHLNESESAGMWKLYAKTNEAVAIRSSYQRLCDQLDGDTYVGRVEYIDFERDWLPERNVFYPFMHKQPSSDRLRMSKKFERCGACFRPRRRTGTSTRCPS